MILVTGATGHFGKAAIDFLIEKGIPSGEIAALVRDEAKAEDLREKGVVVKIGDYLKYETLVNAFKGVDKLLLVSSSDVENRSLQHANAVNAAKEAGVKYILYTSFERKNDTESSPIAFIAKAHLDTEELIKNSGIPYTIFRNNLYMDFIPVFIGDKVLETGVYWPAGSTEGAFATRSDMAEAAAVVLAGDGHEGKEYAISNIENISFHSVAEVLSQTAGKPISYTSPSADEYKSTLTQAGVPAVYIDMFAAFAEAIKQGEFEINNSDLQKLLGRKPTTLAEYLKDVYASN